MPTPTLLDTVTSSSASAALTSNSVSPSANKLLVVIAAYTGATVGTKLPFSISNTLGLTFTKRGEHEYIDAIGGSTTSCVIYTAPLSGSPGSGTVTVTAAANCNRRVLWTVEVDTFNTSAPVKQEKGDANTTSPHVVTFDTTPDSDSLVLAAISVRGTVTVTGDSDYTQLASTSAGSNQVAHLQYDTSPPDATIQWTPNAGTYSSCAIEIDAQSTTTTDLDLVSYSSTIYDITILEHEIVPLDLVSYSSTVDDVIVLENELVVLDLVSYSSILNDLTIIEHEIVPLDLVTYSTSLDDITILESEIVALDLVPYTRMVYDISILENEIVVLDLVSYSSTLNDLIILEHEIVPLDLVSYTRTVYDIDILEEGIDLLDLVSYSSTVYDIVILEHEIVPLDLVSYTRTVYDITILEESETIVLDLVTFISVFPGISILGLVKTPGSRCFPILEENRFLVIESSDRTLCVLFEDRTQQITQ